MRRKRMTQRVAGRPLGDARCPHRFVHTSLDHRFVDVMTEDATSLAIAVTASRRKDPLPGEGAPGFGVFPVERPRQPHPPLPLGILLGMMPTPRCQMPRERLGEPCSKHRDKVLVTHRSASPLALHPAPRARQRSLQYFTCSQQAAHFFRH